MTMVRSRPFAAALALASLAAGCKGGARPVAEELPTCVRCHGLADENAEPDRVGLARSAPPRSTLGAVHTSDPGVGAHREHLVDGSIRRAIECRECHVVPTVVEGHYGGGRATITFGGDLGRAQSAVPSYDPETVSCSNVYCHGATLAGGLRKSPVWTTVDGSRCDSCHGFPPPGHVTGACSGCHPGTVLASGGIDVAGGQHIDGVVQKPAGGCAMCHGSFPPNDAIHTTHASGASPDSAAYGQLRTGEGATATSYSFGCGECHPLAADEATMHQNNPLGDGIADVVLTPPATPVAGDYVKSKNGASASYDRVAGKCTSVYCHSSGTETPIYVTTPDWRNPPAGGLGCDGCHENPPKYGATVGANSHVFFDPDGWEAGHFAGMPGAGHQGSKHGGGTQTLVGDGYWGPGQVASPITCQTCHFDTVDPTNILSDRFFYFDTSGTYQLAGGNDARFSTTPDPDTGRPNYDEWRGNQCSFCHSSSPGAIASAGVGRVRPALHVNGVRDVVFDRRTTYGAPLANTNLPSLLPAGSVPAPYYVTTSGTFTSDKVHPDTQLLATTGSTVPQVLAVNLANAAYDPITKTCSNISCHLLRDQDVTIGNQLPLVWGSQGGSTLSQCAKCHGSSY